MKQYIAIVLLGILAIGGWQQVVASQQELAIKEATINNLMVSLKQAWDRPPEIEYRIVERPVEKVIYNTKTVYQDRPIDRIVVKEKIVSLRSAENLDYQWLFDFIGYASFNHQFYAQNPSLQTKYTGDTTWNLQWVEFYRQIQVLLSEIKERQ